jgi:hypothetical protein
MSRRHGPRFPHRRHRPIIAPLLPLIAVLGLLLPACSSWDEQASFDEIRARVTPSGQKVVLLGIDGAAFRVIDPLVAAGELPNTARLLREGVRADLQSVKPMKSPALWTSMVTGHLRSAHGVDDFVVKETTATASATPTGRRLVSARDRRRLALWNIASGFDLASGVIGWWVTWPAEPIVGYMISDRAVRSRWTEWTGGQVAEARTYPATLMNEITPLVIDPVSPPLDEFATLIDWTDEERRQFLDVARPIFAHGFSVFKFAHCNQRSYEEIALHQLESTEQPALTALFLIALDPVCHTFWHYYEPQRFIGVHPADAARLGGVVPAYYGHNDAFLGRLLAAIEPGTVVLVVSDHGFQASGHLPRARNRAEFAALRRAAAETEQVAVGQSGKHHVKGVLIAWGGPVRAGVTIEASVHDITPTVLALLGLPVGRDMVGRVLTEMIEDSFWNEHPVRYVDTYERLIPRPVLGDIAHAPDPALMDQLRALGYVSDEAGGSPAEGQHDRSR